MLTEILRRGNIVGTYSNQSGMGIIEVVEPMSIQLDNSPIPDDIRDIFGLPITDKWLKSFAFKKDKFGDTWINDKFPAISIRHFQGKWFLVMMEIDLQIEYVHELQNLFIDIAHNKLTAGDESDI